MKPTPTSASAARILGVDHGTVIAPANPRGHVPTPRLGSLVTRLSLSTALIFLLGVWSLAFYASHNLQQDLQELLGAQQLATVSTMAADVEQEIADRKHALDTLSVQLAPLMAGQAAAPQALLDQHPQLQSLFNGGLVLLGSDGTALADAPRWVGRIGQNYSNNPDVTKALRGAGTAVSRPAVGRLLKAPAFAIIAPVHDAQGRVIGALMGLINLGAPNFLDGIGKASYGKTGGFLLVAPQHGVIITATDKSRAMEALPARGVIPAMDRFVLGYEGSDIFVNAHGVEVLTSAKRVPAAGWIVAAALPTAQAFAPVHALQRRIVMASLALSLLAAVLIGWATRRLLAPMRAAASMLAAQAGTNQALQPLPPGRNDEIGALTDGFNQVLAALAQRETLLRQGDAALRASEQRLRALVEHAPYCIHEIDLAGRLTSMNPAGLKMLGVDDESAIRGLPYLDAVCERDRQRIAALMTGALAGQSAEFTFQGNGWQQFQSSFVPIADEHGAVQRLMGLSIDVTERNQASAALVASEQRFKSLTALSSDWYWQQDSEFRFVRMDGGLETFTGISVAAHIGLTRWDLPALNLSASDWDAHKAALLAHQPFRNFEIHRPGSAKRAHWVSISGEPVFDAEGNFAGYQGVGSDITTRKLAELALQAALRDKEALLKEVHHRVKNNLQVVTSLLRLASARSGHAPTKGVLADMQGRIHAMASLHESIYRAGTFASIDLGSYLGDIATQAVGSLRTSGAAVRLRLELGSVQVGLDQATPCGLLLTELASNALKHGFATEGGAGGGEVCIALQPVTGGASGLWCLRVSDNGIGLPADFAARQQDSLGLQLVASLAMQLDGILVIGAGGGEIDSKDASRNTPRGASFAVTFAVTPPAPLVITV